MKILGPQGVITIYEDQQITRNIERDFVPSQRNVHYLTAEHEDLSSLHPIKEKRVSAQLQSNEGVKKVP